jgi:hypothetical protein
MRSARSVGRIIGVLLFLNLASGLTLPFILLRPQITGSPAFLANAAGSSFQIRGAIFLSFVGGALTVAIAITTFPVFRRYSYTMALWFLAVCVVSCSLDYVHNATVLSMLSLSQEYAKAGAADAGLFQALGAVVASTRRWAHYTQLLGFGGWIFLFYLSLWRFALIPRAMAALGLIGIVLQFTGITLLGFLGYPLVGQMAMPMGPIHLAVALWLMVKGFDERRRPLRAETHGSNSPGRRTRHEGQRTVA